MLLKSKVSDREKEVQAELRQGSSSGFADGIDVTLMESGDCFFLEKDIIQTFNVVIIEERALLLLDVHFFPLLNDPTNPCQPYPSHSSLFRPLFCWTCLSTRVNIKQSCFNLLIAPLQYD